MVSPPPSKSIGFFGPVDACDRPGCPVCRCLAADADQYLDGLRDEQVARESTPRAASA